MIKRKYVFKITLCFLIVAVSVLNKSAQSQQMDNEQTNQVDLGRDNPFARLIKKENPPVLPKVSETTIIEGYSPELSVRTVMLKFLDAKSLKQAIEPCKDPV